MTPPNRYRAIQPAPAKRERSGASSGSSAHSGPPWLSGERQTKRLKAVTQACHACRRNKMRCDGERPKCGGCVNKALPCGYEGEAGQSRQAALKSRLQALEKLVRALQSKPDDEAEQLLQRIRTADDILSVSSGDDSKTQDNSMGSLSSIASSSGSSQMQPSTEALSTTVHGPHASDVSSRSSSLVRSGQGLRVHASAHLFRLVLPDVDFTKAGVESFFSFSGKLFHVFSQQDTERFSKTIFGLDGRPDISQKVAICCLCAVAAVGIQYNCKEFERGSEEVFYDVSRHFFSDVLEQRPLDAIKVCTLYALYNIMNKATVALAYVEVGLSMSRKQATSHASSLSISESVDFRRTWRTLVFFSSWLSSTLGYISSVDDSAFGELVPIAEQDADNYSAEVGELVQAEITKISLLKADILRTHLAVEELSTPSMNSIREVLYNWHEQLPPQVQLQYLQNPGLPPLVRWSIYHTHLLYQGAFMLVYRRIVARCFRAYRNGDGMSYIADNPVALGLVEQGVRSAKDSARILGLLLSEEGVIRRCWIVIFQTHTACIVILHSVAQKQLHGFPPSSWEDEMKQAQKCLDVLEFCGAFDPVALRFRVSLSRVYNTLKSLAPETPMTAMTRVEQWLPPPPEHPAADGEEEMADGYSGVRTEKKPAVEYLFTIPPGADQKLLNLSFHLLVQLCRPWRGAGGESYGQSEREMAGEQYLAHDGQARALGTLDWDFTKVSPFRWDTGGMGMLEKAVVVDASCFLDSEAPSGWSQAEDVEVEGG
ncbi:Nitrogen assimilation transcription factor nit-4 [Madurella mycetomatis]|uniref:Nitrogen assimilation transcription factor nit-4 n=1 Tax=Madurella mycetomatis TaxID=100816 RepID=A0A175VQ39_9PEZI|nr:Nitrogen assimilation transcription factor nit-4 [Madurella mycetomatis]